MAFTYDLFISYASQDRAWVERLYDDLLARAAKQVDADRRRELLREAERVMLADQPLIPLYFYVAKHLVNPRIRGWRDNPENVVYSKELSKDPMQIAP